MAQSMVTWHATTQPRPLTIVTTASVMLVVAPSCALAELNGEQDCAYTPRSEQLGKLPQLHGSLWPNPWSQGMPRHDLDPSQP